MKHIIFILLAAAVAWWLADRLKFGSPPRKIVAERIMYKGWEAIRLANADITVTLVPQLGGRIMQYSLGPHPYLFVYKELEGELLDPDVNRRLRSFPEWRNYGGDKTWLAPQQRWGGPPDPYIDSGRYAGELSQFSDGRPLVRMTSPAGAASGMTVIREIGIYEHSSRVTVQATLRNGASQEQQWSIWNVTQINTGRIGENGADDYDRDTRAFLPLAAQSRFPSGFKTMGNPNKAIEQQWDAATYPGLLMVNYLPARGKIGADTDRGWMACVNQRTEFALVQRFPYVETAKDRYPDGGMSAEIWVNGPDPTAADQGPAFLQAPYIELELLSPEYALQPSQTAQFTVDWFAVRCPSPILEVKPAGCVSTPPTISPAGLLEGVFGVFYDGQAEARVLDSNGSVIEIVPLGPVAPDSVFRVQQKIHWPDNAVAVELRVATLAASEPVLLAMTHE